MKAAVLALSALKTGSCATSKIAAALSPSLSSLLQINPCSTSCASQHACLASLAVPQQHLRSATLLATTNPTLPTQRWFAAQSDADSQSDNLDPKLPYDVMRSAIYESDVHVEQIGELAKFMKIRRAQTLYGDTLESYQMLRALLGGINRRHLVRYLERARRSRLADRRWAFLSLLEGRLDMTLLRTGLTHNIRMAQNWVRHNKLLVNGRRCNRVARETRPGDVIAVPAAARRQVLARLAEDVEPFHHEVASGGVGRRAVHYVRPVRVQEAAALGGVHRLGLGQVARKVLTLGREVAGEGTVQAPAAAAAVARAVDSSSAFNEGRRKQNQRHHPYRMTAKDMRAQGGLAKAGEEQLRRSFRAMLRQEAAAAGMLARAMA